MKSRQLINRLQTIILKDAQEIFGLMGVAKRDDTKKFNQRIELIKNSIRRKRVALYYLRDNPDKEFGWVELSAKFKFRPYKL